MNPFQFPCVYLASQSPRRAQLLQMIGIPFEVYLPEDTEAAEALEVELSNESPLDYVQRVASLKAEFAAQSMAYQGMETLPILCADTTVAVDQHILAKPTDAADARRMLRMLSGRTHQVHTAVAVMLDDVLHQVCVTSDVTFKWLADAEIEAYIASGEPFGKAGAYAIQGYASAFVSHLSGSYSAVMGLPVFEVAQMLASFSSTELQCD